MGPEATKYHKRIAKITSYMKNENYSDVMRHIRTRLSFSLFRGTIIAIRGDRGRKKRYQSISELSYNLIPEPYEMF